MRHLFYGVLDAARLCDNFNYDDVLLGDFTHTHTQNVGGGDESQCLHSERGGILCSDIVIWGGVNRHYNDPYIGGFL